MIAKIRKTSHHNVSIIETAAMTVGGVRGAITLAGIMSLPMAEGNIPEFPMRDLLITFVAGVIIASILVGTIFLPIFSRYLSHESASIVEKETDDIRYLLTLDAISEIERQSALAVKQIDENTAQQRAEVTAAIMAEYRFRLQLLGNTPIENLKNGDLQENATTQCDTALVKRRFEAALRLHLLRTKRKALTRMRLEGMVSDEAERQLIHDFDLEETMLFGSARALPRHQDSHEDSKAIHPLYYTG
ncbi:hypothetical protein [Acetobacter syzygii]|uniref:hypothetical protein n=1 Tax=Acetobacter syzygii TaxID=146476 RepID=UPI0039EA802C